MIDVMCDIIVIFCAHGIKAGNISDLINIS